MNKKLYFANFYANKITSAFFSKKNCICCNKQSGGKLLCKQCERFLFNIIPPLENRCKICGKPLLSEKLLCVECKEKPVLCHTDLVFPLHTYRLWKKDLLFAWKMEGERSLSPLFAALVNKALLMLSKNSLEEKKQIIVPVPARPGKIKKNGWDQVNELCHFLSKLYGFTVVNLLTRLTTEQQKKKTRTSRLQSVGSSFALRKDFSKWNIKNKVPEEVVLIDDVITTGATIESCATLLKSIGVAKVQVVSLFIVD